MTVAALMIAQTAMSVIGGIQQGNAQAAQYKQQAEIRDREAVIQKQNADRAYAESSAEQERFLRSARAFRGKQVASIAESGIGMSGTGGDLLEQTAINQKLDQLAIAYEGDTRAKGLIEDSNMARYEAGVYRSNAKAARASGYYKAIGTLAGGGSDFFKAKKEYGASFNNYVWE